MIFYLTFHEVVLKKGIIFLNKLTRKLIMLYDSKKKNKMLRNSHIKFLKTLKYKALTL